MYVRFLMTLCTCFQVHNSYFHHFKPNVNYMHVPPGLKPKALHIRVWYARRWLLYRTLTERTVFFDRQELNFHINADEFQSSAILFAGLLFNIQYAPTRPRRPPFRHKFSWFSSVFNQLVPKFHAAIACFSCSPPYLNSSILIPLLQRPTHYVLKLYILTLTVR